MPITLTPRTLFSLALPLAMALLSACAQTVDTAPGVDAAPEPALAMSSPTASAEQMIVVTTHDWDAATARLQRYERQVSRWQKVGGGRDVSIGRSGAGWGLGLHPMPQPGPQKREGDGRSPAGVFALSSTFGYAAQQLTEMHYQPMHAADYCIDVPTSPLYNRIVDTTNEPAASVAGSTEPMRLDLVNDGDPRYAMGVVVEHNPEAVSGMGSCIFMHLWRQVDEATAGCTAMPESDMQALFDWLDPTRHPVLVLLPESEYTRLTDAWELPALEPSP